jgi:hypothetical protein
MKRSKTEVNSNTCAAHADAEAHVDMILLVLRPKRHVGTLCAAIAPRGLLGGLHLLTHAAPVDVTVVRHSWTL